MMITKVIPRTQLSRFISPICQLRFVSQFNIDSKLQDLSLVREKFKDEFNLYNKITLIERYLKGDRKLRIGLISNDKSSKRIVETMLVDPFDVKPWYTDLKNRDLKKNNLIRIGMDDDLEIQNDLDVYDIPVGEVNDKLTHKNIEFLEINNLIEKDSTQIEGAQLIKTNDAETVIENNFQCHFYIHIKTSPFEELPNDDRFVYWPIWSILNTKLTTSRELIVDIESAYRGNELLIESTNNSSEYLKLILNSNLYEFIELLNDKTPEGLNKELLNCIINQLYDQFCHGDGKTNATNYLKSQLKLIDNDEKKHMADVVDWEQKSHLELQKVVKPNINKLTNPNFNEVLKMLLKIDDLIYYLQNQIITKGNLVDSSRYFNYILGKLQQTTPVNLFDELQEKLNSSELPQLQTKIHDQVFKNFWLVQIPLLTTCTVFHIFYNFDINTMLAVLSLGFVISLNNISKTVLKQLHGFNNWYLEELRRCISDNSLLLRKGVNEVVSRDKTILNENFEIIKRLEG